MLKTYRYTFLDNLSFYCSYFWYKLILPLEVIAPRFKLWLYEWHYSLAKFGNYQTNISWKYPIDTIKTKFGTFKIRINTSDAANVSPAFERRDQNYLVRSIQALIQADKKVLFCDIGGDLGSYSVLVGNRFRGKAVSVACFEPIEESCALIRTNCALNHIENMVEVFPHALLNENNDHASMTLDSATPGSSSMKSGTPVQLKTISITTRTMDTVLFDRIANFDAIVCKIDVEGVEQEVLEGAEKIRQSGKDIILMVEDFINPRIITYLQDTGWSFCAKVTSYNSWWRYSR